MARSQEDGHVVALRTSTAAMACRAIGGELDASAAMDRMLATARALAGELRGRESAGGRIDVAMYLELGEAQPSGAGASQTFAGPVRRGARVAGLAAGRRDVDRAARSSRRSCTCRPRACGAACRTSEGSSAALTDATRGMERELTIRARSRAACSARCSAAAGVYIGLKSPFTESGLIPASVPSVALFTAIGRPMSAQEYNVSATCSGGAGAMAATAGLIGPVAAMSMMGHSYSGWVIAVMGLALGVFGVPLAVPLREPLVVDAKLPFPSGTAAGEVIRSMSAADGEGRGTRAR